MDESEFVTEGSARLRTVSAVFMALGSAFFCASAHAACDLIPQAQQGFRGDLGTINRPFASPGDVVELDVRQALCDGASTGLLPTAADHLVTVVFQPPGGTRRAVVLAADCSDPAVQSKLTACNASLSAQAPALCMDGSVANRPVGLAFKYRGTQPHLTFRFPNTDELFAPAGDGQTLSGPVAIGVTGTGPTQALPCDLSAALPCRNRSNLIACIDSLYAVDGTCVRNPQDVDEVFSSFTALPPPNDYQHSCFSNDPPCDPLDPTLQIAIDRIGNMLIPMDWRGVLANQPGVAIPRLLRATFKSPVALTIPSPVFLHSYTPDGAPLPPIFEPQADETAVDPTVVTLFGSVDAPTSVLRIAHNVGACLSNGEPCATVADCHGTTCARTCDGGTRDGLDCATSGDCPGGVCPLLYDDAPLRAVASQGAIDISRFFSSPAPGICQQEPHGICSNNGECTGLEDPCVNYALEATLPVALESLTAGSSQVLSLTARESVVGLDLNGDADQFDLIATLRDRHTGDEESLPPTPGTDVNQQPSPTCGTSGTQMGRALVEIHQPPFSFAAMETENDIVAFLQSEYADANCEMNGDGDRHDEILRVFSLGAGEHPGSALRRRAVEAAPRINERSLAISNGKVFFRSSEAGMATEHTAAASFTPAGVTGDTVDRRDVAMSGDGSCIVFTSRATDLLGPGADTNGFADAFVRDRTTGVLERVSLTAAGGETNGDSYEVHASGDCRWIAFSSMATNLTGGGPRGIFLRDRCVASGVPVAGCSPATVRVDLDATGGMPNGAAARPRLSPDGRRVVFESAATDLVSGDADINEVVDVFIRDRCVAGSDAIPGCIPATERVSLASNGTQSDSHSGVSSLSDDGRYVAFASAAHTLGIPNPASFVHIYVRDRTLDLTLPVDVATDGGEGTGNSAGPRISGDGRYVMFSSVAPNLIFNDTNDAQDVFVRDLQRGVMDTASIDFFGSLLVSASNGIDISRDGRYVLFSTPTNNVLMASNRYASDIFVRDRLTATTDRVSTRTGVSDLVKGGVECLPGVPGPLGGSAGMMMDRSDIGLVFDAAAGSKLGTIANGGGETCSMSADGSLGYAPRSNVISVIDTKTDPPSLASGINPIVMPSEIYNTAMSADGRFLLVCRGGPIDVVDTETRSIVFTLPKSALGEEGCAAVKTCDDGTVLTFVPRTISALPTTTFRLKLYPDGTLQRTDGGATQHSSINLACGAGSQYFVMVSGGFSGSPPPFRIGFYRMADGATLGTYGYGSPLTTVVINRAGTRMYLRTGVAVEAMEINAAAGQLIRTIAVRDAAGPVPLFGVDQMALDPSETKLYVSLDGSIEGDYTEVLDAETLETIALIGDPTTDSAVGICTAGGVIDQPNCSAMSADGQVFAFMSRDASLYPAGGNPYGNADVFERAADPADPLAVDQLLFQDGRLDDTVLEVLDTSSAGPPLTLCPAEEVVVAGGKALFLRPESANGTPTCPGGSLNDGGSPGSGGPNVDTDVSDLVVQLWPGSGAVENQRLAATAVAISEVVLSPMTSETYLAALVSEAGQNIDLDGDATENDTILHVRSMSDSGWTNVAQAADSVRMCGSVAAFTGPGAAPGERVLNLYDVASHTLIPVGQPVEDFVCNATLLALRTRESVRQVNLNGDGGDTDTDDDVLQLWNLGDPACHGSSPPASCLVNTGQAVTPCALDACDPRVPYRVLEHSVKFLTFECDQGGGNVTAGTPACAAPGGTDLNGDDTADDLILQVFDIGAPSARPLAGVPTDSQSDPLLGAGGATGSGTIFVATGRCIEHLPTTCTTDDDCGVGDTCVSEQCVHDHRACQQDEDCPEGVACEAQRSTPASPDSDGDGVPDHVDDCRFVANADQSDADGDGAGDVCDAATCGNDDIEGDEQCEAGDAAQCAGGCVACQCVTCGNIVTDPKAKVQIVARNEAGKLSAKMVLDLGAPYAGEPVSVQLTDTDPAPIARESLGALPPLGRAPFKRWRYKVKTNGLMQVMLKTDSKNPAKAVVTLTAKRWFTAAAANGTQADTKLTVTIGTRCFTHVATSKHD